MDAGGAEVQERGSRWRKSVSVNPPKAAGYGAKDAPNPPYADIGAGAAVSGATAGGEPTPSSVRQHARLGGRIGLGSSCRSLRMNMRQIVRIR